ncbi:hypothetical protein MYP_4236 [Sporocytophaga myxococcoides]|uniref:Uncharacterized protein n=1 Tax=Sporocytophaga myxococcoides TaxID=153721 RepID=A0A098LKW1_9BACT|nr:hypothetical protein MYP_4236 [Sporocytophaga myxococcoides]
MNIKAVAVIIHKLLESKVFPAISALRLLMISAFIRSESLGIALKFEAKSIDPVAEVSGMG